MRLRKERIGLFRESIAWQKAMALVGRVYKLSAAFPPEEKFGLTSQLRRAAVSVPSNIAEGKGRSSSGELTVFLGNARGSLLEVQTQLEIAYMLEYATDAEIDVVQDCADEVLRILNASLQTLRTKKEALRQSRGL